MIDLSHESALREAGYSVEVIPNQGRGAAMVRIESARRLFRSIWFNEAATAAGIEALGWYHEKKGMTSASSGWILSAIGQAMQPMLLGLCASPLKTVFGHQGQWALSARAVRWRFGMKTTTDLASPISVSLYPS